MHLEVNFTPIAELEHQIEKLLVTPLAADVSSSTFQFIVPYSDNPEDMLEQTEAKAHLHGAMDSMIRVLKKCGRFNQTNQHSRVRQWVDTLLSEEAMKQTKEAIEEYRVPGETMNYLIDIHVTKAFRPFTEHEIYTIRVIDYIMTNTRKTFGRGFFEVVVFDEYATTVIQQAAAAHNLH